MFGTLATKQGVDPNPWDYTTRYIDETVAMGGRMYGQATTRSINAVFSLKSYLPFDGLPAWKEIRGLPLAEQKQRLADPEVRRRLIDDETRMKPKGIELQGGGAAPRIRASRITQTSFPCSMSIGTIRASPSSRGGRTNTPSR